MASDIAAHLVYYYGTKSVYIAELGKQMNLSEKICAEEPYIKAEVIYAIRHEMAVHLKDVVYRRLGIGFLNTELTKKVFIPEVANLMQKECKWSDEEKKKEIEMAMEGIDSLN